jgi:arginyl-tRNA synthetase
MRFDPKAMVDFEKQSGAYLQYCVVRLNKLLSKMGEPSESIDIDAEVYANVKGLIEDIHNYPTLLASVTASRQFHLLASFLYQLAQKVNRLYAGDIHFTKLEGEQKAQYYRVLNASKQVLENGLSLLNISIPTLM